MPVGLFRDGKKRKRRAAARAQSGEPGRYFGRPRRPEPLPQAVSVPHERREAPAAEPEEQVTAPRDRADVY